MSFKQIAVALSTATLALGATAASAVQYGDENDASWVYAAPTAQKWSDQPAAFGTAPIVRFGDENDTSWIYSPAKPAQAAQPRQPRQRQAVRAVDENGTTSFYHLNVN